MSLHRLVRLAAWVAVYVIALVIALEISPGIGLLVIVAAIVTIWAIA